MGQRIHRRQLVGGTISSVFAFFKEPTNLEIITPPWLGFTVTDAPDQVDGAGVEIGYRLRLWGVPLRWRSRIAEYTEGVSFADEMVAGPYRHWYHRHRFEAIPGGVEMEDVVDYSLPLGALGGLAHGLFVRRQLGAIFDFRARRIARLFPLAAGSPGAPTVAT